MTEVEAKVTRTRQRLQARQVAQWRLLERKQRGDSGVDSYCRSFSACEVAGEEFREQYLFGSTRGGHVRIEARVAWKARLLRFQHARRDSTYARTVTIGVRS